MQLFRQPFWGVFWMLILPSAVQGQQSNWTPARQWHAVDQWRSPASPMWTLPAAPPTTRVRATGEVQQTPSPFTRAIKPIPDPVLGREDFWIVSARDCDELAGADQGIQCLQFSARVNGIPQQIARDSQSFFQSIRPGVPVCIVVHGSFISDETLCEESAATYRWLRRAEPVAPLHLVFFSWPSDVDLTNLVPVDLNVLGQRSDNYGLRLAQLIARLPAGQPVSLIGHSHGARLVSAALHLLAGGDLYGETLTPAEVATKRPVRVVFAAAALDHHWFNPGEPFGRSFHIPEAILNLRNSSDYAMFLYPLHKPFGSPSLGGVGPAGRDVWQWGQFGQKFADLDVAGMIGLGHTWPNYLRQPGLAQVMSPYVFFSNRTATVPRQNSYRANTSGNSRTEFVPQR